LGKSSAGVSQVSGLDARDGRLGPWRGAQTAGEHRGAVCCVVDCGDIKKDRICFSRKGERRDLTEVNFDNTDRYREEHSNPTFKGII